MGLVVPSNQIAVDEGTNLMPHLFWVAISLVGYLCHSDQPLQLAMKEPLAQHLRGEGLICVMCLDHVL